MRAHRSHPPPRPAILSGPAPGASHRRTAALATPALHLRAMPHQIANPLAENLPLALIPRPLHRRQIPGHLPVFLPVDLLKLETIVFPLVHQARDHVPIRGDPRLQLLIQVAGDAGLALLQRPARRVELVLGREQPVRLIVRQRQILTDVRVPAVPHLLEQLHPLGVSAQRIGRRLSVDHGWRREQQQHHHRPAHHPSLFMSASNCRKSSAFNSSIPTSSGGATVSPALSSAGSSWVNCAVLSSPMSTATCAAAAGAGRSFATNRVRTSQPPPTIRTTAAAIRRTRGWAQSGRSSARAAWSRPRTPCTVRSTSRRSPAAAPSARASRSSSASSRSSKSIIARAPSAGERRGGSGPGPRPESSPMPPRCHRTACPAAPAGETPRAATAAAGGDLRPAALRSLPRRRPRVDRRRPPAAPPRAARSGCGRSAV